MSHIRFPWPRATELDGAIELKARNVTATLDKDYPELSCWIQSCRKKLREGQKVYRPTRNYNSVTNKTIAHCECIDSYVAAAKLNAQVEDRKRALAKAERDGVILPVPSNGGSHSSHDAKLNVLLEKFKSMKNNKKDYDQGYAAGYAAGRDAMYAELLRAMEQEA